MEDQTITVNQNWVTKQLIVGSLGQLHIDVITDKLKNIYNIDVKQEVARIAYKETIKGKSDVIDVALNNQVAVKYVIILFEPFDGELNLLMISLVAQFHQTSFQLLKRFTRIYENRRLN